MTADQPSVTRQAVMVLAIGLALYAQLAVHANSAYVVGWLLLGTAALLAAVVAGRREPVAGGAPRTGLAGAGTAVRLGLGALAVAAIAATTYLSTTRQFPVLTLLLWFASPVIGSFAVRGWQVTPARRAATPWSAGELAALGAILAVAALLRTLWLAGIPRIIFGDEPRVGLYLVETYRGGVLPSFFVMGWNTWPAIGLALQGLFGPLLGVHIWTLRLSSALMGTLSVLTTYLVARELFARRPALIAALLYAVCRTAIDFSRLGIAHAQVLCLEPLAFFLLWKALNSGRAAAYLWAGVATAWCLYSYNAGQLVPPLVFGWLLLGALVRPSRLRTHGLGAALVVAGFALTLFPYLYYFTDAFAFGPNWGQWTIMARNRQTFSQVMEAWRSAGFAPAWDILSRQIWTTWLGFGVLPGAGYMLGYRRGGMLDDVSAALFIVGLGMGLRRLLRGSDAFLLYWWLGTVVAGGIATIDPPSFVRMVGILPVLALIAAQPLDWLLRAGRTGLRGVLASALVALLLVYASWDNYRTYFQIYGTSKADPISELGRLMESVPSDHNVALLGVEHFLQFRNELFVMEYPERSLDVAEPSHFLPIHQPLSAPLVLVLGPTQVTLESYLRGLYPNAPETVADGMDGEVFRTITLTPGDVLPRTGLMLTATRGDGLTSDVGVSDPFAEPAGVPADATTLVWSGSVYWPSDRTTSIHVEAGQQTTVTIGDAPPIAAAAQHPARATVTLPRGWQPLRIEQAATPSPRLAISVAQVPLTRWNLRPQSNREGLLATYVHQGGNTVHAIDPQVNAFVVEDRFSPENGPMIHMPFTATWRGALRIDAPGTYGFEALGSGPYTVRLDGTELFSATPAMPEQPALSREQRTLTAGLHPIEVDFDSTRAAHTTRRLLQLFWTPPGGTRVLIPPGNFTPPA